MAEEHDESVIHTPTYILTVVIVILILVSVVFERGLHHIGKWLKSHNKKPLQHVIEKIKEELMVLGFISIALSVFQKPITGICVHNYGSSNPFLQCPYNVKLSHELAHTPNTTSSTESHETLVSHGPQSPLSEKASLGPPPPPEALSETPVSHQHGRRLLAAPALNFLGAGRASFPPESEKTQRFLPSNQKYEMRRRLSESTINSCKEGQQPLVSAGALHQLHILLFLLATIHILYSFLSMFLASIKVHFWKKWEAEAQEDMKDWIRMSDEEKQACKATKLVKGSSFVKRHTSFMDFLAAEQAEPEENEGEEEGVEKLRQLKGHEKLVLIGISIVRPLYSSIVKADYIALRLAFISTHRLKWAYNFHDYCVRAIEHDFCHVVGMSWYLWLITVGLIFLSVGEWNALFFIACGSLLLAIVIGTKLAYIMGRLALEVSHVDSEGTCYLGHRIRARDDLFWFRKPILLLYSINVILFLNAFNLSFFLWKKWTFGKFVCAEQSNKLVFIIVGLVISTLVTILLSFVTLPLYSLVTHMGTNPKKAIFTDNMLDKIGEWRHRNKPTVASSIHKAVSGHTEAMSKAAKGVMGQVDRGSNEISDPVETSHHSQDT